jgi:HAMP domain-containing protein
MQDLLKEAIADAKAVKETAIANAKLALEEAFTPRIQSMISSRLEEEEGMEDEEMSMEAPEMGDSGMDVGDLSIDVDGDGQFDEFDIMSKGAAAEDAAAMEEPVAGEEELDEYDLSEILRQLDEEEMEDGMHDMEEGMSRSEVDAEEEEHLTDLEEEVDIDALLEELMADEEMYEMYNEHPVSDKEAEEMMKMKKENEKMKKELEEAYNAIATMRDSLNEVNMLNAKLLFTNKLFKAHNLNEGQKVKVIDTFDRARTIREVKLVYATLSESFSSKKTLVKESVASKPVASTKPTKIILTESEQIANRFKKLAGLK